MPNTSPSVLVVDDHPLFLEALRLALQPMIGPVPPTAAASLADAIALLADRTYSLVLVDLMLSDAGGVESVARLRSLVGRAKLVVVSGRDDAATVRLAKAVGADAFISKGDSLVVIQQNLRRVLSGELVFPERSDPDAFGQALARLTPAQARVLAAAATGKLNKQIAFEMGLAEATVKAHMSAAIKRLGVNNRTQAILRLSDGSSR